MNDPDIYLEISARGTGKTYRLIEAVAQWIRSAPNRAAVIHVPSTRLLQYILKDKRIEDWMQTRIWGSKQSHKSGCELKHFYDDFDWVGDLEIDWDNPSGYYATSTSKERPLEDFSDENSKDNLVRLVRLCGGKYTSYIQRYFSPKLMKEARESLGEVFKKEYLNQFLK